VLRVDRADSPCNLSLKLVVNDAALTLHHAQYYSFLDILYHNIKILSSRCNVYSQKKIPIDN